MLAFSPNGYFLKSTQFFAQIGLVVALHPAGRDLHGRGWLLLAMRVMQCALALSATYSTTRARGFAAAKRAMLTIRK